MFLIWFKVHRTDKVDYKLMIEHCYFLIINLTIIIRIHLKQKHSASQELYSVTVLVDNKNTPLNWNSNQTLH